LVALNEIGVIAPKDLVGAIYAVLLKLAREIDPDFRAERSPRWRTGSREHSLLPDASFENSSRACFWFLPDLTDCDPATMVDREAVRRALIYSRRNRTGYSLTDGEIDRLMVNDWESFREFRRPGRHSNAMYADDLDNFQASFSGLIPWGICPFNK
jgi:hypothetical protein